MYASLPEIFQYDPRQKKHEWKLAIEENLRKMLLDNDEDRLPEHKVRNPAYPANKQFGETLATFTVSSWCLHVFFPFKHGRSDQGHNNSSSDRSSLF